MSLRGTAFYRGASAEQQVNLAEVGPAKAVLPCKKGGQAMESGGCNLQLAVEDTQHSGLRAVKEMATYIVDIDLISPDPTQTRKDFNHAKLSPLKESIQSIGSKYQIVIRPHPTNNQWIMVDGECRVSALRDLGKRQVPCQVKERLDRVAASSDSAGPQQDSQ